MMSKIKFFKEDTTLEKAIILLKDNPELFSEFDEYMNIEMDKDNDFGLEDWM